MTTTEQTPTRRQPLPAVLCTLLLYAVPLAVAEISLRAVARMYMSCTGSEVLATEYRMRQFFWIFALPVAMYIASGLARLSVRGRRFHWRLMMTVVACLCVSLIYVCFNARYFTLDQNSCVAGLPAWWPEWLPAGFPAGT